MKLDPLPVYPKSERDLMEQLEEEAEKTHLNRRRLAPVTRIALGQEMMPTAIG